MSNVKGRNIKVEISQTLGVAKTVSGVTKASPGVATSTAHGLAEGTIGYWTVTAGMTELDGMAGSVDATATNTWNVEAVDTTNFTTFTAGTFTPVATWVTLSPATGYDLAGGDADEIDVTTLLDNIHKVDFGLLGAETVNFNQLSDTQAVAALQIEAAARAGTDVTFRITLPNGERRVFRGVPSLPGESLALSQAANSSFKVAVKGRVLRLPVA